MADDGAISDGSDIDDGDTEIGSNTGSSSTSLSSESDLEERHAVGEQWVRNLFAEDDSVFAGFQAAWKERNFVERLTMDFRGIGGASVLHPPEANPGMYFDQFWTGEMWQQLVDETNRYADQERRQNPLAPIWTRRYRRDEGVCWLVLRHGHSASAVKKRLLAGEQLAAEDELWHCDGQGQIQPDLAVPPPGQQ